MVIKRRDDLWILVIIIIIVNFIFKTLIVAVITLVLLTVMRSSAKFKTMYYKYVYDMKG